MYCQCPDCKTVHHLSSHCLKTQTLAEWIAEFAPDTKPGEAPLVRCFRCWTAARNTPPAAPLTWRPRMCERCKVLPATWANDDFRGLIPREQRAMTHCDDCLQSRDYDLPVSCEPDLVEALWALHTADAP